ncbi:alpha 1 3 mannosyl glycoprotein [Trichuris trichiura]|uniref:Alpha-1,3-mannosyl-glycoprotein 2-beta-N-acetylglucosaminyltransferase n=1 Tax=Trichuris trichiura TaxID=36087 RepID=A0A077Z7P9_TRITR|nr:alpha 1 3 mannosyl glycoprotein [Trichuris trichiura]
MHVKVREDPEMGQLFRNIRKLQDDIQEQNHEGSRLLYLLEQMKRVSASTKHERTDANTSTVSDISHIPPIAVLVFACNRPTATRVHLNRLLELRPSKDLFPVVVSQDCNHEATASVIRSYGSQITFLQQPNQTEPNLTKKMKKFSGYYKIARHYRWALDQVLDVMGFKVAIVTEDDLMLANDFFEYFSATYKLLLLDATLYCVSAWNDNGKLGLIEDNPELLYRTDFFPGKATFIIFCKAFIYIKAILGLGWMLTKELWHELSPKWPTGFWDDWIRSPEQRLNRACIRPEISRTAMSSYGKVGVSRGLFYEMHLKSIVLNSRFVPFTTLDLSYLLKDKYDKQFLAKVKAARQVTWAEYSSNSSRFDSPVRVLYDGENELARIAKQIGFMEDLKAGVPRTAYKGVVTIFFRGTRTYFAPNNWEKR